MNLVDISTPVQPGLLVDVDLARSREEGERLGTILGVAVHM